MSRNNKTEPWRSPERHFCAICNTWMGSDRASILIHEQGKKHKEQLAASLQNRRDSKLAQEKAASELQRSLTAMNAAAVQSHLQDVPQFGNTGFEQLAIPEVPIPKVTGALISTIRKNEKKEWASRVKKRGEEKKRKEMDDTKNESQFQSPAVKKTKRKVLGENEGNYCNDGTVYLEGVTFVDLLEDEMTVELWAGNALANLAEKRLLDKSHLWIKALVILVRQSSKDPSGKVLDVAFLKHSEDTDETIEKSVSPDRIRMILGLEEKLPSTLEEARLAIVGEELITVQEDLIVDENTGLSSWGTVEVRKTTVRNEERLEREQERVKKSEEKFRLEQELRKSESKRMEEQKVDNSEDSALGAYNAGSSGNSGYKGIFINTESKLSVADTAKSLSKGRGVVEFKKKSLFKVAKKHQNRRTTSAEDD